jgi:rod shape-determining protein MreD
MRVFIIYLVLAFFALSLQATIFPHMRPDLILILVCFYSLREGQMKGMVYGALVGLLIDSASGFIIGPNILSKSAAGFFFKLIRQKFFVWNMLLNTLLVCLFSIFDTILVRITLETFLGISFASRSSEMAILTVLYTTAGALIAYPLLISRGAGLKGD